MLKEICIDKSYPINWSLTCDKNISILGDKGANRKTAAGGISLTEINARASKLQQIL